LVTAAVYQAFISLLRHARSWEAATDVYQNINVPALLICGDQDWSRPGERERNLISSAQVATIKDSGHFLPLDRPTEIVEAIMSFAAIRSRRA
jgi:pimeloyl-ACP methyl ester carboxylesterase